MLNILQLKKGLKGAMGGMTFGQPWPHLHTIAFYPKNEEVRIILSAL